MIIQMEFPDEGRLLSDVPASSSAGWRPAPDGSAERSLNNAQAAQEASAIAKLSTATRVLLIIYMATSLAKIGVEAFGIIASDGFLNGGMPIEMLDVYDQSSSLVGGLSTLCLTASFVLWLIWQYRVAKRLAGRTRRSPGWHVGSWFVPIISLWYPYQNISDLWRAIGRTPPPWQIVW